MRIVADHDRCAGLGMCEALAPDAFEVGGDGLVRVLDEDPAERHREDLTAAVDACPMLALTLRD